MELESLVLEVDIFVEGVAAIGLGLIILGLWMEVSFNSDIEARGIAV